MTSDNQQENTTAELVGVPTPDGVKNIHPKILAGYKSEAFDALSQEASTKAAFKEVLEAIHDTTGIPANIMSKWFKAAFKDETTKPKELADTFEALDSALDSTVASA